MGDRKQKTTEGYFRKKLEMVPMTNRMVLEVSTVTTQQLLESTKVHPSCGITAADQGFICATIS